MKVSKILLERKINDGKYGSIGGGAEVIFNHDTDTVENAINLAVETVNKVLTAGGTIQNNKVSAPSEGTGKKSSAGKKQKQLEGDELIAFKLRYADKIAATRKELSATSTGKVDGGTPVNDDTIANILAHEMGVVGAPLLRINELDEDSSRFSLEGKIVSISGEKSYGRGNGSSGTFVTVIVEDGTGDISGALFDKAADVLEGIREGDTVLFTNILGIGTYNGKFQLKFGAYTKATVVEKQEHVEEYVL